MWGVHDSMLLLRRLLYIALVQDSGETQARWRKERGFLDQNIPEGCQLNSAVRVFLRDKSLKIGKCPLLQDCL